MRRKRHPRVSTSVVRIAPGPSPRWAPAIWADFDRTQRWPGGRVYADVVFFCIT